MSKKGGKRVPQTGPSQGSNRLPAVRNADYVMPDARKPGASLNPNVPGAPRIGDTVGAKQPLPGGFGERRPVRSLPVEKLPVRPPLGPQDTRTPSLGKVRITTQEGQPAVAVIDFPTQSNVLLNPRTTYKRAGGSTDTGANDASLDSFLVPNSDWEGRKGGERVPMWWQVSRTDFQKLIIKNRGLTDTRVDAGALQSILRSENQSGGSVNAVYEGEFLADRPQTGQWSPISQSDKIWTIGQRGDTIVEREIQGPIDTRKPGSVVDPAPVPGEVVFEAPSEGSINPGVYYFKKNTRLFTRGNR